MEQKCRLSVFCTAYNHEAYIAQTLDSFLRQKTDFPFEVLVTDDASTDGTTDIIRRYAEEHPDVIRFFHQEKNLYSQGIHVVDAVMYPNARGEYIAYCEGDDYWTDDTKLQRQVDFLDAHPDSSACEHNSFYHNCSGDRPDELLLPEEGDRDVPFSVILSGMSHCFHTSSIVGRASIMCSPPDFQAGAYREGGFTDYAIALWLSLNGKIRFLERSMSVYRVNSNPESWSSGRDGAYRKKLVFVRGEIAMMKAMLPHLDPAQSALTEEEIAKREYELAYLEGDVNAMLLPRYRRFYRAEPMRFRLKTQIKRLFPALHERYRRSRGYEE